MCASKECQQGVPVQSGAEGGAMRSHSSSTLRALCPPPADISFSISECDRVTKQDSACVCVCVRVYVCQWASESESRERESQERPMFYALLKS